uniref:Uncharacterized protein n=1 Tax=Spongospora subterranea TaxID=70186 RepID=A0A0H5RNI6_9EUKA|eukprot:CRZ10284.1 hypothetical protein [Spongospora subterranea]
MLLIVAHFSEIPFLGVVISQIGALSFKSRSAFARSQTCLSASLAAQVFNGTEPRFYRRMSPLHYIRNHDFWTASDRFHLAASQQGITLCLFCFFFLLECLLGRLSRMIFKFEGCLKL